MPDFNDTDVAPAILEHDQSRAVRAPIGFLKKSAVFDHEEPYAFRYISEDLPIPQTNMETEYMNVDICDLRGQEEHASLNTCGFQTKRFQSAITYDQFNSPAEVKNIYLRDLEQLLLDDFDAAHVEFDRVRVRNSYHKQYRSMSHMLGQIRRRHPDFPQSTGEAYDHHQPSTAAHVGM